MYIQALDPGTRIAIQYLNRKVVLEVREYDGNNVLDVVSVENGSLQVGDVLHIHRIKKGSILEAECVERGSYRGNYKTTGEVHVIDFLRKKDN